MIHEEKERSKERRREDILRNLICRLQAKRRDAKRINKEQGYSRTSQTHRSNNDQLNISNSHSSYNEEHH